MKKLLCFGFALYCSASYAQGHIKLTSGERSLSMSVDNDTLSDSYLAFNGSDTLSDNFDDGYALQSSISRSTSKTSAPSIAAQIASRSAHSSSRGRCAAYVRKALQAAGYSFTPQSSAYQYANGTLKSAGFVKINTSNYEPKVGDVAVFNRTSKNPHGHIQIYDGNSWVSDFRQPKFSPYSQHNGYTVWRDARNLDASIHGGTYLALNDK